MGRKRIELASAIKEQFREDMKRGMSSAQLAAKYKMSERTTKRRMQEQKAGVETELVAQRQAKRVQDKSTASVALPEADAIPVDAPLEQLNAWLRTAREEVDTARAIGDIDTMQKMMRIAATLLALQQRYTAPPPPDPNANPDMIEAATRVRKKWHALADRLVEVSKSGLADSIANLLRPPPEEG